MKAISGDAQTIYRLTEALRRAFQDALQQLQDEGVTVDYADGFMAAQTFHRLVVEDLEERTCSTDKERRALRLTAAEGFRSSLLGDQEGLQVRRIPSKEL